MKQYVAILVACVLGTVAGFTAGHRLNPPSDCAEQLRMRREAVWEADEARWKACRENWDRCSREDRNHLLRFGRGSNDKETRRYTQDKIDICAGPSYEACKEKLVNAGLPEQSAEEFLDEGVRELERREWLKAYRDEGRD